MSSFEEYVELTQAAQSLEELAAAFKAALADEGYQNFVWSRLSYQTIDSVVMFDFPEPFPETYLRENWAAIDPVVEQLFLANQPFKWSEVNQREAMTRAQREMVGACQEMGVHSGVAFPFQNADGKREILSISLRDQITPDPSRMPFLQALCTQTWARGSELGVARQRPDQTDDYNSSISRRERECLNWLKAGKTNAEMAKIMGVSVKTIEFHISNILAKLSAPNRISAVVIALQKRIIHL